MRVQFCGLELRNPILAASGTFGYGIEFDDIVDLSKIGGFITKGISREPMAGNPAPRIIETSSGMMNAIGLQNIGVEAFLKDKLPRLAPYGGTACIVNVFGFRIEDYLAVIEALNPAPGIAAYELNASCPNTRHGGQVFGTDGYQLRELVSEARAVSKRPLIVKLSPNVTSIASMALTAQDAGADALSLVNTFVSLAIDVKTRKPQIANVTGGLSGPAIRPIALRMVYECWRSVSIPILGMGGIMKAEDAVEFMLAGATAVQIGTASYADPRATERIAKALESWCANQHIPAVHTLTGSMQLDPQI
jgi:dihydroorotate dehydrogenase (NAD+) catalytic subunit